MAGRVYANEMLMRLARFLDKIWVWSFL